MMQKISIVEDDIDIQDILKNHLMDAGYEVAPVIMLTALSDEENQLRGFEQQIDDYIPKPFSPKILLCKIAAILRRRTAENHNQYQSGKYDGQGVFHEFTQESVDAMGRCSPIIMNQEKDTGILKVQFNVRYILFYCQNLLRLKLFLF